MKYNAKEELLVEKAIEELGEASIDEIAEYIQNHWETLTNTKPKEISNEKLLRYVRRWNKRGAVSGNLVNDQLCYSLSCIPWWPKNQVIRCLKAPTDAEASAFIEVFEKRQKERTSIRLPKSVYRDYKGFTVTCETIDNVAGGLPNGERKLKFPRNQDGDLYIPINWLKGWLRENSGLADLPQSVFVYKTGFSVGKFEKQPKIHRTNVKVKTGLTEYEYIGSGERFTFHMNYPMHGTAIKKKEQLQKFLEQLADAPIRGLGSYPARFGGRIKIVDLD